MNQEKKLVCRISKILNTRTIFLKKSGNRIFDSISVPKESGSSAPNYDYRTNFSVSIILGVVNKILLNSEMEKPCKKILGKIQKDASKILLSEKTPMWTWNYWRKDSIERSQFPYPDDLDDTSCALFGLLGYFRARGLGQHEGEGLAYFINLLNKQRIGKTGCYKTWILSKEDENAAWKDVDLVVQSNIANLLSKHDIKIKSLEDIFEKKIRNNHFDSKYYPREALAVYFISRHYDGKALIRFGDKILERLKETRQGLDSNLLVCALINCINNLAQKDWGARYLDTWEHWLKIYLLRMTAHRSPKKPRAEAFCNDPRRNGVPYCNQSATLTCLIEMEAMSSFLELQKQRREQIAETDHYNLIKEKIVYFTKNLPGSMREEISSACDRILNGKNQREVWLLSFWWNNNTTNKRIVDLSYANTLGWVAYRIYDDCLDGTDLKSAQKLPMANICMYEAFATFLDTSKGNGTLIKKILQRMESAIARENLNKKSDRLQEKSIAHSIGPLIISSTKEGTLESRENVLMFFKYYLTARQLADDIRDKTNDETRGFRNLASRKSVDWTIQRMETLTEKARLLLDKIEMDSEKSRGKISEMLCRPRKELAVMMRNYATEKTFVNFTDKLRKL